jgi:hypothetical protein
MQCGERGTPITGWGSCNNVHVRVLNLECESGGCMLHLCPTVRAMECMRVWRGQNVGLHTDSLTYAWHKWSGGTRHKKTRATCTTHVSCQCTRGCQAPSRDDRPNNTIAQSPQLLRCGCAFFEWVRTWSCGVRAHHTTTTSPVYNNMLNCNPNLDFVRSRMARAHDRNDVAPTHPIHLYSTSEYRNMT